MKLHDLFEQQKNIEDDYVLPHETTKLDYKGVTAKGDFYCADTKITSLVGSPKYVGGTFSCARTKITSLEGAPGYVGEDFFCYATRITSLHNVHTQIKHIGKEFVLPKTIKSNVIGVMMIKGLKGIQIDSSDRKQLDVENIINKHLKSDRDVHACQEELIEAGLSEFAKI